jgi:translocation and assembly module TamB
MSRPLRIGLWIGGGVLGLVLLLAVAAVLILPSKWFQDKVRDRIVYELERSSGGRAEIGSFTFDWRNLRARIAPVVLRGTEPATEAPLFRAEYIEVGLKIISIMKRDIDIASLVVEKPAVNLIVDEKGITNFPTPKVERPKSDKDPIQTVLDLAVGQFRLSGGSIHYSDRKIPMNVRGENLDVNLKYDFTGPRYAGTLNFERLRLDSGEIRPVTVSFESQIKLEPNTLVVDSARLGMARSNISIRGGISNFKDPEAKFDVRAVGDLSELGPPLQLPPPHMGVVRFTGTATYRSGEQYQLAGRVSGRELAVAQGGFRLNNVSLDSHLQLNKDQLLLKGIILKALDGSVTGDASLTNEFKSLKLIGRINGVSLASVARAQGVRTLPWNGTVDGPLELTGSLGKGAKDMRAAGTINIAPARGETPIEGKIQFAYDQASQSLQLGNSYLNTPESRMQFTGTLGKKLDVRLETRDLNDLLPVIAMASPKNVPKELPVKLNEGGSVVFEGTVLGPTAKAQISGTLNATNFKVQNQQVDTLVAQVNADPSGVHLRSVAAAQGSTKLEGSFDVALANWKPTDTGSLTGKVRLQGVRLKDVLTQAGQNLPIDGLLSVDVDASGTSKDPQAVMRVLIDKPTVYGERFDRIRAEIRYTGTGVEVINGQVEVGSARILLAGAYTHPLNDLKNGNLRFEVTSSGFTLAQFEAVRKQRPGTDGEVDIKAVGQANVRNGEFLLTTLNGQAALRQLVVDKKPIGNFIVDANTAGNNLTVAANGNFRGSQIKGNAAFQLTGDYVGSGQLDFSPLTFSTVQDLIMASRPGQPMPFDGTIAGRLTFSGPARKPDLMRARLELPTLEMVPTRVPARQPKLDLALRNQGPVVVELDPNGVHVRSAKFVGPETNLEVAGTLNYKAKRPWDLRVNGTLNLEVLENFNQDWVTSGTSVITASVRGSLEDPQVAGRMELKNASFYIVDLPNGVDQANGVILFDRNRATIENLTATTGGGKLSLSGFVGFAGEVSYRLQARADGVRVRYPEGVSLGVNANINAAGNTSRGIVSGTITVLRAAFNPQTDVGGLLQASAKPIQTPATPNEFLRNTALDLRIETVPNLTFQTALTSDLQAEADLRVRGTAAKPAVLGRVTVNQGEIQFFGNKYTINRGEIGFYNPVRIEPVLDMDLETRVRGIQVNITFSGPITKLNFSYRSDPPMQTNEVISLLAMGRAPDQTAGIASSQVVSNTNYVATGTNALLGQAIAAPVSGRLQRFFGVSRLKIDPNLQNLDATPQARLTLEQNISKNVTLTYITNLANANQQIVRLEVDLNRNWSVVAVREENGLFGVDFLYKKRFR